MHISVFCGASLQHKNYTPHLCEAKMHERNKIK